MARLVEAVLLLRLQPLRSTPPQRIEMLGTEEAEMANPLHPGTVSFGGEAPMVSCRTGTLDANGVYCCVARRLITVAETPLFNRQALDVWSDAEREAFVDFIARNPEKET